MLWQLEEESGEGETPKRLLSAVSRGKCNFLLMVTFTPELKENIRLRNGTKESKHGGPPPKKKTTPKKQI